MKTGREVQIHAIYSVAGDDEHFAASIASIYKQIDGITVFTGYDRDWSGTPRSSDAVVARLLSRELDPDGRVQVVIDRETNEARSRNRAMDFAAPSRRSRRVRRQSADDHAPAQPDFFLIIDADEIYEDGAIDRLREFVVQSPRKIYRVPARRYFKTWNWRVTGYEWSISLVRADVRLPYLRRLWVPHWRRAVGRFAPSRRVRELALGYLDIPPEVAVFHHGSYVGPRSRIAAKLASFGHAHEVPDDWLERTWEKFSPDMRNFNPAYPSVYAACETVETEDLPAEISDYPWPPGYLR
ncbi:MAG: hypothetical protein ABIP21_11075 [Acidimicrobiia bacterium]